jgi:glycosyltransferase involved in cell wall biosynthesis
MIVGVPDGIRSFVRTIEDWLISRCAATIIVDDTRVPQLTGSKPKRLEVIYNVPEESAPEPMPGDGFTVFYAGIIARERGLVRLLEALKGVSGVRLVVAGTGPEQSLIVPMLKANTACTYLGEIPYAEVLRREASCDLIVALYDPAIPNNRFASPNKLFEAMMLRRPIIVTANTTMATIVESVGCGIAVSFDDPAAIRAAIERLRDDPTLRERMGEAGRAAYESKYRWSLMQERLVKLYAEVLA